MIELLVADALEPGAVVLLPWPDWGWRRFVIREAFTYRQLVELEVQAADGEDAGIRHHVARRPMEPIHVVIKNDDPHDVCKLDGCTEPVMARTSRNGARPGYCCNDHRRRHRQAAERARYRARKRR